LVTVTRLLNQKNSYLAGHPRARVAVAGRDIQKKIEQLQIEDWARVKSQESILELVIDDAALKEAAKLDGCYVIKTDLSAEMATVETIHDRYKDLAEVERAFRTFKNGHLQVQPTFVRREASTRGHVFTVMLAYLVERELEQYWRYLDTTVPEGIDDLGSLRGIELTIGQATCQQIPEPTGLIKHLLDAANIKLPEVLPARRVHVATRKKLVSQRRQL
jgi:hypothetical protein